MRPKKSERTNCDNAAGAWIVIVRNMKRLGDFIATWSGEYSMYNADPK